MLGGEVGALENYIKTRRRAGQPGEETQLIKMKLRGYNHRVVHVDKICVGNPGAEEQVCNRVDQIKLFPPASQQGPTHSTTLLSFGNFSGKGGW